MITLGKRGTLHARRRALRVIRSREVAAKVFGDLADRYRDRAGGYTRVLKLGNRVGDAAPVSLVELVDAPARKGGAPAAKPGDKAAKKAARAEQKAGRKAEKAAAVGKSAADKAAAKKGGRGGRAPATRSRGASRESS
jgi:large subunit ribosomal protein L17